MRQSFIDYMRQDTIETWLLSEQTFYNQAGDEFPGDVDYTFKHTPEGITVIECSVKFKRGVRLTLDEIRDDLRAMIEGTEHERVTFECSIEIK